MAANKTTIILALYMMDPLNWQTESSVVTCRSARVTTDVVSVRACTVHNTTG